MKKIITLCLTAGMLLGVATGASAIDFKAKGQWIFGFGMVDTQWDEQTGDSDTFAAQQRVRLQLDAVASEALSGTVAFEIGDQTWGNAGSGGALGADGIRIEVRSAYLDWIVPNTELSFRMGIQPITLPNVAGGSAVLDDMAAGVVASYKINDMASVGFAWVRPYNDNWSNDDSNFADNPSNYLDNVDLFALFVPLSGDGWKVTPWVLGGAIGVNAVQSMVERAIDSDGANGNNGNAAGYVTSGLVPAYAMSAAGALAIDRGISPARAARDILNDSSYGTAFWAGLPMAFQYDAWNFELDINYGSVSGLGDVNGFSLDRRGWLVKGLAEYQMDWGTPGLFAWYGSGDDDDLSNGSEMMPYLNPCGNFTSFMGDGNELGYSIWSGNDNLGYDLMLNYSGTWGIGLQITDLSFVEKLTHTIRVAYWGGTNSSEMADVIGNAYGGVGAGGFYLTTDDHLVEINFDSTYEIYENLDAILQVGYIFNGVNSDTWDLDEKRDGYRVGLMFNYSF